MSTTGGANHLEVQVELGWRSPLRPGAPESPRACHDPSGPAVLVGATSAEPLPIGATLGDDGTLTLLLRPRRGLQTASLVLMTWVVTGPGVERAASLVLLTESQRHGVVSRTREHVPLPR